MKYYLLNLRFVILLAVFFVLGSAIAKNKKSNADEKATPVQPEFIVLEKTPVIVLHDTLFNVYGNIGSFTSKQRAKSIENKIAMLADDYLFEGDSIQFVDTGNYLNIMYQKEILMSVDTIQAAQENKTKLEANLI